MRVAAHDSGTPSAPAALASGGRYGDGPSTAENPNGFITPAIRRASGGSGLRTDVRGRRHARKVADSGFGGAAGLCQGTAKKQTWTARVVRARLRRAFGRTHKGGETSGKATIPR